MAKAQRTGQGIFFLALGWVIGYWVLAREPTAWWPPWQALENVDNMFSQRTLHFSAEVQEFRLGICRSMPRYTPRRRCRRMLSAQMSAVEGDRGGDVGGMAYGDVTAERYSGYRSASRCWSQIENLKGHRESKDLLIQSTFRSIKSGKTRASGCEFDFLVQTALARSEDTYTS
ncbi:hypothetical protein C8J56DRAFT_886591 [Mycena floridula]|nr:hypothetical protein C8J56DRAFT_886591 [Mycena floridula]